MVFLHSSLIVNISISCCETDRNVFSSPFFPIASIFGPKETILRGLGNQSVKVSIAVRQFIEMAFLSDTLTVGG